MKKKFFKVLGVAAFATVVAFNINAGLKNHDRDMDVYLSNIERSASGAEVTFCIGPNPGGWGQCVYYSFLRVSIRTQIQKSASSENKPTFGISSLYNIL